MASTMQFDERLKEFFEAETGAYSIVTKTEAKDGQVTVVGYEKEIVVNYFGQDELKKYEGNDRVLDSKGLDARREFRLFPEGRIVKPKLKYPKQGNSELRLYFNDDEFKVFEGHFWGVFRRKDQIWIFQMPTGLMESLRSGDFNQAERGNALENEIDDFQILLNSELPAQRKTTSNSWNRDIAIARRALENANFTCEIMPELPTFISRASGECYVEAHHLIPMKMQANFSVNLDIEQNICCLSPFVHRKIHHAQFQEITYDIKVLLAKRKGLLEYVNISEDELLSYYRV